VGCQKGERTDGLGPASCATVAASNNGGTMGRRGVAAQAREIRATATAGHCSLTYPFGVGARGSCVGFLLGRGRRPQLQY